MPRGPRRALPRRSRLPLLGLVTGLVAVALVAGLTASGNTRDADGGGSPVGRPAATAPQGQATTASTPKAERKQPPKKNPTKKPSKSSAKPAKPRIPASGPRKYAPAKISAAPKSKRGNLLTYNVRVQRGLPYDPEDTARFIHQVLNDKRSWGRSGDWRLKLVSTEKDADFEVYLVTRNTTDRLCAPLRTEGRVSCYNKGRVVLNAERWAYGAKSYGKRVVDYRRNLVNHEVGHALGYGHEDCRGKGKRAPIMMQQTKGLHGCRANPWPNPGRG